MTKKEDMIELNNRSLNATVEQNTLVGMTTSEEHAYKWRF